MADDRDPGPALGRRLGYLLKHAMLALEELHEEYMAPTGVTVRELGVLLMLADREPESQQQAARRLGVDRTSMVGLLDVLEAKSLVVRRPDSADRRRNVVELTATGRTVLDQATRASDEAEQAFLAGLGDDGASRLRALLGQLALGESPEPREDASRRRSEP
ncbi:MarR family transcriptional regulator [Cellulomonas sp. JH27-2]|uniref:MarR family winged helix-turn-helix transcriptional regulator n=1 Tax=Cellulomonas sp. JH27-2 TaxID=2774139 RepID=UPI0017858747|nr:MarR family transcriptional regulator [Cellulomonas sp. JH27-2]MBD8059093.1 MarR family transcriptional regulator [Cellulomonas sp. JH27-2]